MKSSGEKPYTSLATKKAQKHKNENKREIHPLGLKNCFCVFVPFCG